MEQSRLNTIKNNPIVFCVFVLLTVYVSLQLFLLTSVGSKGQDLANIRNQQGQIKVENEILKAKILELKSNQVVISGLEGKVKIEPKNIAIIKPEEFNIAAQN
jgi:hypothetical protein